ncbi:alpha/beta hydrolase [Maribacter algicola]|uniref:Alpha/beta hydrolase n=1 Tax=Meishania litoralis TaxID=3434685 RepID=A0ACC7LFC7_9FLAO
MKRILFVLALGSFICASAQQIALKKGVITDAVSVLDTVAESFALYLPTNFDTSKKWPVVFVFDMKGRGRQALGVFKEAAEEQGYILASSNNVSDSLSLTDNMLVSSRMFNSVYNMLPAQMNRTYVAGFSGGGRFSSLIPTFIKTVKGVISCGSAISTTEVLSDKNPFHFIGIVGNLDYSYPDLISLEETLDRLKFPNQLLVFEGGHEWPPKEQLSKALELFTLGAMADNIVARDTTFIHRSYKKNLGEAGQFVTKNKPLLADRAILDMIDVYRPFISVDSLKENRKTLKKNKFYRSHTRSQNSIFFKESLIKDDYDYYLEEDIMHYNFNNLGWWKYQMEELEKYDKSQNVFERQMGVRLRGYINALVADNIDLLKVEPNLDLDALNFLYMLKTIIDPKNAEGYLKVISISAQIEDYGTALFYLEELLKTGYDNRSALYEIENTALLRITPEYNKVVEKYLKEARYDIIER